MRKIISNLGVYGLAHAVIDATCAAVLFSLLTFKLVNTNDFVNLVLLYSLLAFGLQAFFGLGIDKLKIPRFAAVLGAILTGISAISIFYSPLVTVIFAGIGNALFHVGGGTISLNLTPKKATAPGIYVAPGAIGLFVGTLIGNFGYFVSWHFILAIIICCIGIYMIKMPEINYKQEKERINFFGLVLILVLLAITVRSFIGLAIVFPWKSNMNLMIILIMAIFLGKGLGGILADKFGWIKIAVGALIISAPLLAFGTNIPSLGIIGMFLFNMTMPVTLVAISNILPGRPGLSFGLTCLGLILGAMPAFTQLKSELNTPIWTLIIILISSLALYVGLKLYYKSARSQREI